MHIRSAKPDDLEPIRRLLASLNLPHSDLTPSHLEHFFVCYNGGEVAGVVGLELCGEAALLRSLAVRPTHRNKGIGTRLTEKVERYGRRRGAKEIYLLTTTASDYFDGRGYETVGRDELPHAIQQTEEAVRLCPSTAICMRKGVAMPERPSG